ncbi:MAG: DMT family transporter [Gemmatimonadota bacterium]|jgi:drug/metabolite transporter (DMT)-like permease|nr:DMT family transporter [Gemmatimonadota bacterium]
MVAAIWGLNFVVVKSALGVLAPLGFNAMRHLVASGFMLVVLLASGGVGRPEREDWPRIVGMGVLGIICYQMAFMFGLDRTRAGNASLMLALAPIFVLLFGGRSGEGGVRAWLGVILSVLGIAIVSWNTFSLTGGSTLIGDLILIGAAAIWALYTIGSKPLISRYGPIRATVWPLWIGSIGVVLAGVPALVRQDWSVVGPAAWGGVLYSACFAIGIAYLLWYRGVERVGGARTAVFSNLAPVVAIAAGAVWLGEAFTIHSLAGALLVIGGLILVPSGGTGEDAPADQYAPAGSAR